MVLSACPAYCPVGHMTRVKRSGIGKSTDGNFMSWILLACLFVCLLALFVCVCVCVCLLTRLFVVNHRHSLYRRFIKKDVADLLCLVNKLFHNMHSFTIIQCVCVCVCVCACVRARARSYKYVCICLCACVFASLFA